MQSCRGQVVNPPGQPQGCSDQWESPNRGRTRADGSVECRPVRRTTARGASGFRRSLCSVARAGAKRCPTLGPSASVSVENRPTSRSTAAEKAATPQVARKRDDRFRLRGVAGASSIRTSLSGCSGPPWRRIRGCPPSGVHAPSGAQFPQEFSRGPRSGLGRWGALTGRGVGSCSPRGGITRLSVPKIRIGEWKHVMARSVSANCTPPRVTGR